MGVTSASCAVMERTTHHYNSWWTTVANLRTIHSPIGVGSLFSLKLVASSPPQDRDLDGRSTQCALHTHSAARVASLLHRDTGDSPPAAAYIAFVFAQPTCSVPLAVAISAPLAAVSTLLGALGSHGSADAMSRQFCRARGWLRARRSC